MSKSNAAEGMFRKLHAFKNLMKLMMKFELYRTNQMKILVKLQSFFLGCGIIGMWDFLDVGYSGCRMFGKMDVQYVVFSECGIFGMWNVWNVKSWECGMLGMRYVRDV